MASGQYLTAVFKLLPTRRKAAVMERVRVSCEEAFWAFMDGAQEMADGLVAITQKADRRKALQRLELDALAFGQRRGLAEQLAVGLARDLVMAISSYVELKTDESQSARRVSWPCRAGSGVAGDVDAALALLAGSLDKETEDLARDEWARLARGPGLRPIVLNRARDAMLVRDEAGRIALVLNCVRASEPYARQAVIKPGVMADSGEVLKGGKSKAKLVVPIACSRWHENKFLNGRAVLRSTLVFRRGDEWFAACQFEMPLVKAALSGASLGVDRGVVFPVASAVVDEQGLVLAVDDPQGEAVGKEIAASLKRRRVLQRRGGQANVRHQAAVDQMLHQIGNEVVRQAERYGAQVVLENLDQMKRVITHTRAKDSRRNPWQDVLKRAQLGKLEALLTYKLAVAGLPAPKKVFAHGTSQTCPACGHRAKENRPERDVFRCVACGHEAHADQNAAIVIARRGVLLRNLKKGDSFDRLHQNMVARLNARPLVVGQGAPGCPVR